MPPIETELVFDIIKSDPDFSVYRLRGQLGALVIDSWGIAHLHRVSDHELDTDLA